MSLKKETMTKFETMRLAVRVLSFPGCLAKLKELKDDKEAYSVAHQEIYQMIKLYDKYEGKK